MKQIDSRLIHNNDQEDEELLDRLTQEAWDRGFEI